MEQLGELLRPRLAYRPLSVHNLRGYAAGSKHREQVALAQTVPFHQAAQPAAGRRSFDGVVGVFEDLDRHGREFGVLPLLRREFVVASIELLGSRWVVANVDLTYSGGSTLPENLACA